MTIEVKYSVVKQTKPKNMKPWILLEEREVRGYKSIRPVDRFFTQEGADAHHKAMTLGEKHGANYQREKAL